MQRAELLERVKQAVREVEPEAAIVLYGSRARGEAHAESDWDFLILLDGVVDDRRTDAIRHRLYDIEWDCGEVLCAMVGAVRNGARLYTKRHPSQKSCVNRESACDRSGRGDADIPAQRKGAHDL